MWMEISFLFDNDFSLLNINETTTFSQLFFPHRITKWTNI